MRTSRRPVLRTLAAFMLLATLLAPAARAAMRMGARPAASTPRVGAPCEPLAGPAPDTPPAPSSRLGLNFSGHDLDTPRDGSVRVCALVDSLGVVREARVVRAFAPFDSAALESVRWWRFEPARRGGRPVAARVTVEVPVRVPRNADPIVPDVVTLARDAEERGNAREALDAWTGALARAGTNPTLGNEWALREHVLRLARGLTPPPEVSPGITGLAAAQHNLLLRNVARAVNADCARALDGVLLTAPWYADAYRWRASARAASGDRDGAWRDALCYALAAPDSAGLAVSGAALRALAVADTLGAHMILKR